MYVKMFIALLLIDLKLLTSQKSPAMLKCKLWYNYLKKFYTANRSMTMNFSQKYRLVSEFNNIL